MNAYNLFVLKCKDNMSSVTLSTVEFPWVHLVNYNQVERL